MLFDANKRLWCILVGIALGYPTHSLGQSLPVAVKMVGALRKTMFEGQLAALVRTDTLASPRWGLGPVEGLRGEVILWNDTAWVSTVEPKGDVQVQPTQAGMPFAAYAAPIHWEERKLPREIHTLNALELFLSETLGNTPAPVFLRLQLNEAEGSYHIVNVPVGTLVQKPDDAHAHNLPFPIRGPGDVLIFYSQNHKAVLTHHDTFLHAHWLNQTRTAAGHVDALVWRGPATLWVAAEKRTN